MVKIIKKKPRQSCSEESYESEESCSPPPKIIKKKKVCHPKKKKKVSCSAETESSYESCPPPKKQSKCKPKKPLKKKKCHVVVAAHEMGDLNLNRQPTNLGILDSQTPPKLWETRLGKTAHFLVSQGLERSLPAASILKIMIMLSKFIENNIY